MIVCANSAKIHCWQTISGYRHENGRKSWNCFSYHASIINWSILKKKWIRNLVWCFTYVDLTIVLTCKCCRAWWGEINVKCTNFSLLGFARNIKWREFWLSRIALWNLGGSRGETGSVHLKTPFELETEPVFKFYKVREPNRIGLGKNKKTRKKITGSVRFSVFFFQP